MFSVPAVERCELRHATTDNGVLCVLWLTGSRMLMLLEAVRYADTDVQFVAEIQCAWCLLFQRTHETTRLPSFAMPVLWMFHFSASELRRRWTWRTRWRAASCHIFFVRMDNQFANEKLPDIFVDHLVATWLMDKKCAEIGMSVRRKNGFLVYFQAVRAIPYLFTVCLRYPQTPRRHCILLLHEVW